MKSLVSLTFVVLLIIPLHLSQNLVVAKDDLITKVCNHSSFQQFCVSILRSDHRSSKANVTGLGIIVLDVVKAKAIMASNNIEKHMQSNPHLKDPFE
ncbi:hypothetical protein CsSME_00033024 [Camellia sinensis var. sinensis]